jgi:GDP-4-dehydro-6-deoxy-D-mannose reductase
MKSLVTGAEGFAGSHLVEYLLAQGEEVIALVLQDEKPPNLAHLLSRVDLQPADVCDRERVFQLLRDARPQRIYHLAAMSSPADSFRDPRFTYEVNFVGTLNLLAAWRKLELDCRFLYVSSADVYGLAEAKDLPLREDAPLRPASPYAGSKAAAEFLALQFSAGYGLPIVRVRPFNHTGPRQSDAFVCSSLARQVVEIDAGSRPPAVTLGNVDARRDFSDVRDIVRGYHLLLEKGEPGEVYQLCSGRAVSISDILRMLTLSALTPIRVEVDESKVRVQDARELVGDFSKAQRAVGWVPEYALETTLQDLKRYWENVIRPGSPQPRNL